MASMVSTLNPLVLMPSRASLPHLEMEYCLTGHPQNTPLLFVHGLGANFTQFEQEHRAFDSQYQVLSLSLRGHGDSTAAAPGAGFTLEQHGQDVLALLDLLQIAQVHYVGNSMGGNVGHWMMQKHPDRLMSLTTFGTTAELRRSPATVSTLRRLYKLLPQRWVAGMASTAGKSAAAKQRIKEMMRATPKATLLQSLDMLADFNFTEVLRETRVPYLLIKGEADKEINKELASTLQAIEGNPCAQVMQAPGAGHFANLDTPAQFQEKLLSFLHGLGT